MERKTKRECEDGCDGWNGEDGRCATYISDKGIKASRLSCSQLHPVYVPPQATGAFAALNRCSSSHTRSLYTDDDLAV